MIHISLLCWWLKEGDESATLHHMTELQMADRNAREHACIYVQGACIHLVCRWYQFADAALPIGAGFASSEWYWCCVHLMTVLRHVMLIPNACHTTPDSSCWTYSGFDTYLRQHRQTLHRARLAHRATNNCDCSKITQVHTVTTGHRGATGGGIGVVLLIFQAPDKSCGVLATQLESYAR